MKKKSAGRTLTLAMRMKERDNNSRTEGFMAFKIVSRLAIRNLNDDGVFFDPEREQEFSDKMNAEIERIMHDTRIELGDADVGLYLVSWSEKLNGNRTDVEGSLDSEWLLDSDPGEEWRFKCKKCGSTTNETAMGEPLYKYCPICGRFMHYFQMRKN